MRALAVIFVGMLALLPLAVTAQQPTVLSGEHDGFSRLVAPLPRGAEWQVTQTNLSVNFQISGYSGGFDVSDVFELIPRDRVETITAASDGFALTLGCACRVAAFVARDSFVVLDIASAGITRSVPFIPVTSVAQNISTESAIFSPSAISPSSVPSSETRNTNTTGVLPVVLPRQSMTSPSAALSPMELPLLARDPLSTVEQAVLDEIQQRLAQEVGSAATRGVLDPVPGIGLNRSAQRGTSTEEKPEKRSAVSLPQNVAGLVNNVRITTSNDISLLDREIGERQSITGFVCPADAVVDLAGWADGNAFGTAVGAAQRDLYREFDRLDTKAALKLARIYLHFGFGAEAERTLLLDPKLAKDHRLLSDIAAIMEDGYAPADSILPSLLDCNTDIALWAFLAREELNVPRSIDASAALLALNKLPVHLRKFLAPALSRRLLSHGDTEAAATALRNLERLPSELPTAAKMEQAKIALDQGAMERGNAKLKDVIDDNVVESPEALIALIDAKLASDQPIDNETAILVEAFAKELQNDALGPDLRRAHVLALVKSGQFERAFQATSELGGDGEDDAAISLRLRLLQELTQSADDIVFLDHVFDRSARDIDRLAIRQKILLAERLLDLGFAARADTVLQGIPRRPRSNVRQSLEARVALALGQPMRVASALLDLSGQDVDTLRGKAKEMEGDHAAAFMYFQRAQQQQDATRAAWLSDEWRSQPVADDTVYAPMILIIDAAVEPSPQRTGMLGRSAAAIQESEQARQVLLDLLRAPELELSDGR